MSTEKNNIFQQEGGFKEIKYKGDYSPKTNTMEQLYLTLQDMNTSDMTADQFKALVLDTIAENIDTTYIDMDKPLRDTKTLYYGVGDKPKNKEYPTAVEAVSNYKVGIRYWGLHAIPDELHAMLAHQQGKNQNYRRGTSSKAAINK